jgi:catechol 2,3-dioxygenase-like lactoylglutathione lyase family enzyme
VHAEHGPDEVVVNHVGLCVTDLERSRRFYEAALGFHFWWELEPPDDLAAPLLGLVPPLGLHAVYLTRGPFVLELLAYQAGDHPARRPRPFDEPGLTHLSFAVADLPATLGRVDAHGGQVLEETRTDAVAMVRDPDGQLIELTSLNWRTVAPPRPAD